MLKIYVMPDGIKRQFEEGKAPEGAVLFKAKPVVEAKAVEVIENKAIEAPKNKAKGKSKK